MRRWRRHIRGQQCLFDLLPTSPCGEGSPACGAQLRPLSDGSHGAVEGQRDWGIVIYRSGMSSRSDFAGYAGAGVPVGVAILDVSRPVFEMFLGYNGAGGRVFVDSNAFSAFRKGEEVDFGQVLGRYEELVERAARPELLALVMPDRIGDQQGTLALLAEYRERVRRFVATGADVLVPLQKGALSLAEVYRETVAVLGTDNFRVGLPSNEEAVSEEELLEFVAEVKPRRLHLLGIARQKRLGGLVERLRELSPCTHVSTDANHLRAAIGRGRPLTEAVRRGVHEVTVACMHEGSGELGLLDESDFVGGVFNTPSYLTDAQARLLARAVTDDEGLREEIIEAAACEERGEEYGSRLGDVLEREFPGRYGEAVLWDAYCAIVGKAAGSGVRTREITRLAEGQRRHEEAGCVPAVIAGVRGVRSGFDIIVANPPYGGKVKDVAVLSRYALAERKGGGRDRATANENLFIEMMVRALAPGGRLVAVVPDSILANRTAQSVRDFVHERCRLRAVLSLHVDTFSPFAGVKTSLLFVQRWDDGRMPRLDDYTVCMAKSERCPRDVRGSHKADGDLEESVSKLCQMVREADGGAPGPGTEITPPPALDELARRITRALEEGAAGAGCTRWDAFRALLCAAEERAFGEASESMARAALNVPRGRREIERLAEEACEYVRAERRDVLGEVFMRLGAATSDWGQFFTGEDEAAGAAALALSLSAEAPTPEAPLTVCDPSCGSGRMLLAAARALPRSWVEGGLCRFYGVDSDPLCVTMTRINLALAGVPCEVERGDALALMPSLDEEVRETALAA